MLYVLKWYSQPTKLVVEIGASCVHAARMENAYVTHDGLRIECSLVQGLKLPQALGLTVGYKCLELLLLLLVLQAAITYEVPEMRFVGIRHLPRCLCTDALDDVAHVGLPTNADSDLMLAAARLEAVHQAFAQIKSGAQTQDKSRAGAVSDDANSEGALLECHIPSGSAEGIREPESVRSVERYQKRAGRDGR